MSKPYNIGVIGLGYWGPNLLRVFTAQSQARVAMACDLNEGSFDKLRRLYPNCVFTSKIEEVFQNPEIDAVAIATPVFTHYPLVKSALEHGKHVLVEKPLAPDVGQAEELCLLAKSKGLILQIDHIFVYNPAVVKIKEIISSGHLGSLNFIDSVRINLGLFQHDVNVLWDLAPHDLSILDYLLERNPLHLSAVGSSHTSNKLEDVAYLNLDYGDSLIAHLHVNWLSPVKIRDLMIGGTKQSLIYNDLNPLEKIRIYDRGIDVNNNEQLKKLLVSYRMGDMCSPRLAQDEPLSRSAADFIECIGTGRKPVADGWSGLRIVKLLVAAERSIKNNGERITL